MDRRELTMTRAASLAGLLLLLAPWARAQDGSAPASPPPVRPQAFTGVSIFVDQDLFHPATNEDRNYTMGVGIQLTGDFIARPMLGLEWLTLAKPLELVDTLTAMARRHQEALEVDPLAGFDPLAPPPASSYALTFGVTAFTPDDLGASAPIADDRPYASLAFLTVSRATLLPARERVWRSDLTIGALGWNIARRVQTWIHEQGTSAIPRGWDNQISQGGELTARYRAGVLQQLSWQPWYDLALSGEVNLGYYTNVAAGLALRAGRLTTDFSQFDPNPLGSYNEVQRSRRPSPRAPELFGFAAWRTRLVAYNALLQGQWRRSAVTFDSTGIEHVVNEFETGVAAGLCGVHLTWVVLAGRSPEIRVADPRSHFWGAFHVSVRPPPPRTGWCG